jgi:hypothetical protein
MISAQERDLWEAAVQKPRSPEALDAYVAWLQTNDPQRADLLRGQLQHKLSSKERDEMQRAWGQVLDQPKLFAGSSASPLFEEIEINAMNLSSVVPILEQLPFLGVTLSFSFRDDPKEIFASPSAALIRRLSFNASEDQYESDIGGGYHRETSYFGEPVLEAICASPNMKGLTSLTVSGHNMKAKAAHLIAAGVFTQLRALSFVEEYLGDEGASALANSPVLSSLRYLFFHGCQIGPDGAKALASSPYLGKLEELYLVKNPTGFLGLEAIRQSKHLTSLRKLDF